MSDQGDETVYAIQYEGEEEKAEFLSKDGIATATFANGDTYTGPYVNKKRHGRGVYTFSNGTSYDGEFDGGIKNGDGVMSFPDKSRYEGVWKAGLKHGRGIYYYANGDRYSGNFEHNKKSGQGIYVYAHDGSMISGTWQGGKLIHGTWSGKDGTKLSGTFNDNVPNGSVHYVFPNGNQQTGVYEHGFFKGGAITNTVP